MKHVALSLTIAALLALPATASAEESEGRRLAELAFSSVDSANRGFVDQGEFMNLGGDVFYSMDSDASGTLSLAEFLSWDFGMRNAAIDVGREDAYDTAMRVVFAFWDRNGDGEISQIEHRQSLMADFQRADVDNDALLSEEEFTGGFSIMVASRAAINPAPVE